MALRWRSGSDRTISPLEAYAALPVFLEALSSTVVGGGDEPRLIGGGAWSGLSLFAFVWVRCSL